MEDRRLARRATSSAANPRTACDPSSSLSKCGQPTNLREFTNHFNNLLAGILGNAQLLEDEDSSSARARSYVAEIKTCAQRASMLTRQLELSVESESAPADTTTISRKRETVLIIDDEDSVRDLSSSIIARSGFEVVAAADGVEGIELFERCWQTARCVFLDLSMPYMRGNLVFARLRAIDANVPIFVMSGHSTSYVDHEFAALGVAGVIHKPFEPQELLNAVYSLPEREVHSLTL